MSQWINGGTPPEKTRLLSLPDVPDINDGDIISRQAAIDALIKWYGCEPSDIGAFENIIEKMPSAQPEQKKGNEKCSNKLPCGWCSLFDTPCFGRGGEQDG